MIRARTVWLRAVLAAGKVRAMIEGKRILITGGLGFIGSHLVGELVEANQLTLLDNGRRDALRLSEPELHDNLTLIEGDVTSLASVAEAVDRCDPQLVFHLAAMAGVSTYAAEPLRTMEVNLFGTRNLLEAVRGRRLDRFVNVSTSEIYGSRAYHASEDGPSGLGPATAARWSYASSKLAAEHLAMAHHQANELPVVSLRPFNVYGPGQLGEGAIRNFMSRALSGRDLVIYGDGSQIRAWCYIADVIKGILAAAVKPEAVGRIFNLGNPRSTLTILDLAERIAQVCGSESTVKLVPPRDQEIQLRVPDITLARRLLGVNPRTRLADGLALTADWYREMMARGVSFA